MGRIIKPWLDVQENDDGTKRYNKFRLCASAVAGNFRGRSTQYFIVRTDCWIVCKSTAFEEQSIGAFMKWLPTRDKYSPYHRPFQQMIHGLKEVNKETLTRWFQPRLHSLLKRQKKERDELNAQHTRETTNMRGMEEFIKNFEDSP